MPASQDIGSPTHVLVCGDWHGSRQWATNVIEHVPDFIPDGPRLLLHAGDFGIWPGLFGATYLYDVEKALEKVDAQLWFVDGNHEDHSRLYQLRQARTGTDRYTAPYQISERITWLPRGYRWRWHGRTWMALGGATSVDRSIRTPGIDWWAGEALTHQDTLDARTGGLVDVMLTHDCPEGVSGAIRESREPLPGWWEFGPAEEHRRVLRGVVDDVQPESLLHGHYHHFYRQSVDLGYGKPLHVVGLDCDGALVGNSMLVNTETMEITNPWRVG
jgi:hypothetical protein